MENTEQATPAPVTDAHVVDFEKWLETQPAAVKELYAAKVGGLKTALDKERETAKANEKAAKRLADFEAAEQKRKEEQMTKEQLLETRLAEMTRQVETTRAEAASKLLKSAVLLKASEMGFEHPADAHALAGLDPAKEYTDAEIEAALKTLTGRLPVKAKGSGIGSPQLPPKSANPNRAPKLDTKRKNYNPL
jgi:Skp family chaperone for outer membrane proteins